MTRPLEAHGLVKRYGDVVAVAGVDLAVEEGDIYGLLGPNGAGKTTTMRILLGLIKADAGAVRVFGRDPVAHEPHALDGVAGFVEAPSFYPYLSGRRNLELLAALDRIDGRRQIDELLERVGLLSRARDRVGGYSQGMRQRLGLAASLLRQPRLLILDEPANGLDPAGMRDVRSLVRDLAAQGITILYSSHLLAEVEELCNRVAIIDRGRVIYEGRLDELGASTGTRYRLESSDPERGLALLAASTGVLSPRLAEGALHFGVADLAALDALTVSLGCAGVGVRALEAERVSLEELFFRLTEHERAAA